MDPMNPLRSNMPAYREATGIALRTDNIIATRTKTNG